MKWSDMQAAVADAKSEIERADCFVSEMVSIVAGRLRASNISRLALKALKRELRSFDSRTGFWRS